VDKIAANISDSLAELDRLKAEYGWAEHSTMGRSAVALDQHLSKALLISQQMQQGLLDARIQDTSGR
jgi:hypothetical protein